MNRVIYREIYLDNSATTRPFPEAIEAVTDALTRHFGNPSSLHKKGLEAEEIMNRARQDIAKTLGAKPAEIIFTSGGTESNNLAIQGVVRKYKNRGNHIVTSSIEHSAVLDVMKYLESEGFQVTYLPVDGSGCVRLEDLEKALTEQTILVSIMYVNNETGAVQPIRQIGELLSKRPKILFHVDAVQAYGKIPFKVKSDKIDLLSVSAHKIHGPKGVGAFFIREGLDLVPLVWGGGQERNKRSGTENVPGIAGFGAAARKVFDGLEQDKRRLEAMRDQLIHAIRNSIANARINTPKNAAAPHVVSVSLPGVKGEVLVHTMETEGIFISTGSACSSREKIHSHVLQQLKLSDQELEGSVRLSLSIENTSQEIDEAVRVMARLVEDLRSLTRR